MILKRETQLKALILTASLMLLGQAASANFSFNKVETVTLLKWDEPRKTYPVIEKPWREAINKMLEKNKDKLKQVHKKAMLDLASGKLKYRPKEVPLITVTEPRLRTYRLIEETPVAIYDKQGRIIYPKGTKVDILKKMTLRKWYIVTKESQVGKELVRFIEDKPTTSFVILITKGDTLAIRNALHQKFGYRVKTYIATTQLVERLKITHTPSIIHQRDDFLVVNEIIVSETEETDG